MADAVEGSAQLVSDVFEAMHSQEEQLQKFVADMQRSMADMAQVNDTNLRMTRQMESLSEMNGAVSGKLAELTELTGKYTRSLAEVQADNSDLSEGLSVMNDANIRMTDRIAKMNDLTVTSLQEVQKAQTDYITSADGYLKSIGQSQETLLSEMKTQQQNLREFTDYMTQVLSRMKDLTLATENSVRAMSGYAEKLSRAEQQDREDGRACETEELKKLVELLEAREKRELEREKAEDEKPRRRGFFGR